MATAPSTISDSLTNTAASRPPTSPERASAPTCNAWLLPITRPCAAPPAAMESKVAHEGRHSANAADVRNRVIHSAPIARGTTTMTQKNPVSSPDQTASVLLLIRRERKLVSQRLAMTIGTPTQATNSETRETPRWYSSTRYMG